MTTQSNGLSSNHHNSRRTDISSSSNNNQPGESGFLAPARVNALNRKDSSNSDTSGPDSLLDLYGKSTVNSLDLSDSKRASRADLYDNEDPESSRWIHRDKLARIESQELQAAGIILPRTRTYSKSGRRDRSRDQSQGLEKNDQSTHHQKRQRTETVPVEEAEDGQEIGWDLRMPEEAAEDSTQYAYRDLSGVKGASKIPVALTSPLPIPLEYLVRDSPMQRTRSSGWTGDEDAIAYPQIRDKQPTGKATDESTPAQTKPQPKRLASDTSPSKKITTPATRKGSAPNMKSAPLTGRPKTRSGSNSISRPGTRSGELGTGTTTKRPEGDPPWLATMYKPDPRLPPDQQLLPTVAKRLQQEQWEKEGKFGNAYDREFRPLNDEQIQKPEDVEKDDEESVLEPEATAEWPLKSPKSPVPSTGRPGTAGGYTTMPKIQDPPTPSQPPKLSPLQQENPKEAKHGGCGCCIVM
jgi:hypothetical protein